MPHPIVTTITLAAGSANAIALSQSGTANTPLTLNGALVSGGVATLTPTRRVAITSAGNDSGITFTVTGTARAERNNVVQSETITGGNAAAVYTTQDFATVTAITPSGNTAASVTAGTNSIASGPWVPWSDYAEDFQVNWYAYVTAGTPSYQVDYTNDDVFGLWLPSTVPFPRAIAGTSATTTGGGQFTNPITASRLTLTAAGTVQLTQQQQGT